MYVPQDDKFTDIEIAESIKNSITVESNPKGDQKGTNVIVQPIPGDGSVFIEGGEDNN
jgi:hypothetical protein